MNEEAFSALKAKVNSMSPTEGAAWIGAVIGQTIGEVTQDLLNEDPPVAVQS